MKKMALLFVAAALMTGVSSAQQESAADAAMGVDDLVRTKGRFKETWVRPGADFSQYGKLDARRPEFQYRDVGEAKGSQSTTAMLRQGEKPYAFTEESKQRFEAVVIETFAREMRRSKVLEVVDAEGPGTLVFQARLLDVVRNVPPDFMGSGDIYVSAVGQADLVLDVIDSETGAILLRFMEPRCRIQPQDRLYEVGSVPAYSNTAFAEVERWARWVARDARKDIEKALK